MPLDGDRRARGKRIGALRERRGLTVLAFAAELNAVAQRIGLPAVWSGPRVTKIEQGAQNLSIEDVATLEVYEPAHDWFWWSFGTAKPGALSPIVFDVEPLDPSTPAETKRQAVGDSTSVTPIAGATGGRGASPARGAAKKPGRRQR